MKMLSSDHLVTNAAGYTGVTFPAAGGPRPGLGWRGGYLSTATGPDPWGNRYAVNVGFLKPSTTTAISNITAGFATSDYPRLDVFVLSAGPDEEIDTRSAQDGAVPGDDDIII